MPSRLFKIISDLLFCKVADLIFGELRNGTVKGNFILAFSSGEISFIQVFLYKNLRLGVMLGEQIPQWSRERSRTGFVQRAFCNW